MKPLKPGFHDAAARSPARQRWMLVDDDEQVLCWLGLLLEKISDAEICLFRSGPDALKAFEAAPGSFQLVITDFDMPGMNGLELCEQLRLRAPRATVILATGNHALLESEASRQGFSGLLLKPLSLEALRKAVQQFVGHESSPGIPADRPKLAAEASDAARFPAVSAA